MELLDAGNVNVLGDVEIRDGILAGGMVLGVVLGRADIDSCIAAGAFLGLATAGGGFIRGGLVRGILGQRKSRQQRKQNNRESNTHAFIVLLQGGTETDCLGGSVRRTLRGGRFPPCSSVPRPLCKDLGRNCGIPQRKKNQAAHSW